MLLEDVKLFSAVRIEGSNNITVQMLCCQLVVAGRGLDQLDCASVRVRQGKHPLHVPGHGTRFRSPRTWSSPRSRNWRNSSTDLMMPNIGSGVCLRNAESFFPSGVFMRRPIASIGLGSDGDAEGGPAKRSSSREWCAWCPIAITGSTPAVVGWRSPRQLQFGSGRPRGRVAFYLAVRLAGGGSRPEVREYSRLSSVMRSMAAFCEVTSRPVVGFAAISRRGSQARAKAITCGGSRGVAVAPQDVGDLVADGADGVQGGAGFC